MKALSAVVAITAAFALLYVIGVKAQPGFAAATGARDNSPAPALLQPPARVFSFNFGALGKPNPNGDDGAPTDAELQKRSPQSILDEFRKRERDLDDGTVAQSSPSGSMRDDDIADYDDVQRVLFYNVALRDPQIIAATDLRIVRADEQAIYEESCGNRGGAEAIYQLSVEQCAPYEVAETNRERIVTARQQADAEKNKQWDTMLNGNKVTCGIASGERWFIIWPNEAQKELGNRPVANNNPSDSAWQIYCGTGAIVGSW